ncbi:hypothetical protein DM01DRAFT_1407587 [Hesseltinella vesiculosa]|uniref:Uncharacterized protein n=1 Tax=Hesseltinella vesiculosa TaxID=101127 RepID=A0A1X2GHW0_9FUNG|nr:hypothetical protein DM01DRAFT_1407587 [Hesseltinella vesiculosa]
MMLCFLNDLRQLLPRLLQFYHQPIRLPAMVILPSFPPPPVSSRWKPIDDASDGEEAKPRKKKRTKIPAKAIPAERKEKKPSKTSPEKKKKKKRADIGGVSDGHSSRSFARDLDEDVIDESDARDRHAQTKRKQRATTLLADSSDETGWHARS